MSRNKMDSSVFAGMGYLFGDEPSDDFLEDWSRADDDLQEPSE